jgi:hypothetical protein
MSSATHTILSRSSSEDSVERFLRPVRRRLLMSRYRERLDTAGLPGEGGTSWRPRKPCYCGMSSVLSKCRAVGNFQPRYLMFTRGWGNVAILMYPWRSDAPNTETTGTCRCVLPLPCLWLIAIPPVWVESSKNRRGPGQLVDGDVPPRSASFVEICRVAYPQPAFTTGRIL